MSIINSRHHDRRRELFGGSNCPFKYTHLEAQKKTGITINQVLFGPYLDVGVDG